MNGFKIWFADDDIEDRMILRHAFEAIGKEEVLEVFNGGIELIDRLRTYETPGKLPALIVLDQNMPKQTGTQTLLALKADPLWCKIPVVVYSTSMNPFERDSCLNAGAVDYVIKPFHFNESLTIARRFHDLAAQQD